MDGALARRRGTTRPDERLETILRMVEQVCWTGLHVVRDDDPRAERAVPLLDGWYLTAEMEPPALRVAAELIRRVHDSEADNESLCAEILERYEEATLVYRLADRLGELLDPRAIASAVLEDAARVLGAERAQAWLVQTARPLCVASAPPAEVGPGEREAVERLLASGRVQVLDRERDGRCQIGVPMSGVDGSPIGALVLYGRTNGRAYRTGEIKLLGALGSLAAGFIRNAQLVEDVRAADARRRTHEIALQVHRGLLPHRDPTFPGLEIAGSCRAAEKIGGDYFGYIPLPDTGLGVLIADISGHGIGAAMYMAAAKGVFHAEARRNPAPAELLDRVNATLLGDFEQSGVFATAFFARFATGGRHLEYSNAGHNPPLLVRGGGSVEELHGAGTALGLLDRIEFGQSSARLVSGDRLVLYTDGLVDARDPWGRMFGLGRLAAVLERQPGASAAATVRAVYDALDEHLEGGPPTDDATLVVIRAVEELA